MINVMGRGVEWGGAGRTNQVLVLIRCDELGPPTRQPVLTDAMRVDTCREGYSNRTSMHNPTQIVQYEQQQPAAAGTHTNDHNNGHLRS